MQRQTRPKQQAIPTTIGWERLHRQVPKAWHVVLQPMAESINSPSRTQLSPSLGQYIVQSDAVIVRHLLSSTSITKHADLVITRQALLTAPSAIIKLLAPLRGYYCGDPFPPTKAPRALLQFLVCTSYCESHVLWWDSVLLPENSGPEGHCVTILETSPVGIHHVSTTHLCCSPCSIPWR